MITDFQCEFHVDMRERCAFSVLDVANAPMVTITAFQLGNILLYVTCYLLESCVGQANVGVTCLELSHEIG